MKLLNKIQIFSIFIIVLPILFAFVSSFQFALASTGGNGPIPASINISNEKLSYPSPSTAVFTWDTNEPATSRVVYGNESQRAMFPNLSQINYGYDNSTQQDNSLKIQHSVTISGLTPGVQYFFRPESRIRNYANTGNEKTLVENFSGNKTGCGYLNSYLRMGADNNVDDVTKLQSFLKNKEGFSNLEITGIFDQATYNAVSQFQLKYKEDILAPWGIDSPTGYVYYTTQNKINEIYCGETFALTSAQKSEIEQFKILSGGIEWGSQASNIDYKTIDQPKTESNIGNKDSNDTLQASVIKTKVKETTGKVRGFFSRIFDIFRR